MLNMLTAEAHRKCHCAVKTKMIISIKKCDLNRTFLWEQPHTLMRFQLHDPVVMKYSYSMSLPGI